MTRQDIMNHHRQTMQTVCAFIAALSLVVMGLVVAWAATEAEKHYAHQALVEQEASVKW